MWRTFVRDVFREERVPVRFLWWLAADGLRQWYSALRTGLAEPLGGIANAERALARLAAPVYMRHYKMLREKYPQLPEPNVSTAAELMAGLMRLQINRGARFMISELKQHHPYQEYHRARRLLKMIPLRERWEELTTHLGEILIALTERLPAEGLSHANAVIGKLCFEMGVDYAQKLRNALKLPNTPQSAIEVLRKGEYIFRVNPQHWSASDPEKRTGFVEGTACPWYEASGWSMMHCGIFGQFQSGVCSVFGLRYQLTKTIPKHGGHTCRVDLRPITTVAQS